MIRAMWIAIDPDHPRRRVAFGDEERARSYAGKLTPAWTVQPAEDPQSSRSPAPGTKAPRST